MPDIYKVPEGPHCYEIHVFGDTIECPDLDQTIVRNPKCLVFSESLSWNTSGRVLKCARCLEVEKWIEQTA